MTSTDKTSTDKTSTDKTSADRETERRAELVRGLRELADFLTANPAVPLPTVDVRTFVLQVNDEKGRVGIEEFAALLGVKAEFAEDEYLAIRRFAGVAYRAMYLTRDRVKAWDEDMTMVREVRAGEACVVPVASVSVFSPTTAPPPPVGGPSHPGVPAIDSDAWDDHADPVPLPHPVFNGSDAALRQVGGESVEDASSDPCDECETTGRNCLAHGGLPYQRSGMSDSVDEFVADQLVSFAKMRGYEDPAVSA